MPLAWLKLKRIVATLCVALVAFLVIEPSFSMDACHIISAESVEKAGLYNVTDAIAGSDPDADDTNGRSPERSQTHHCCVTHIAGLPSVQRGPAIQFSVALRNTPQDEVIAPNAAAIGPERPPRAITFS